MRIEALRSENRGDRARVAATVVWEDCDREPQEIYFETTAPFADGLTCDPHAFLVGAVLPAIQRGERRIAIDAPICSELRTGVLTAIEWLRHWSLLERSITIEASSEPHYPQEIAPRAACFLSGGVDSMAMLCANRFDFPRDHPNAFQDCLFVHGFDIGGLADRGPEMASFDLALEAISSVAHEAGVELIPVFTNVRHLYDDIDFWIHQFHGAAMAAVAHAFSRRLTSISIASGFCTRHQIETVGHPLIQYNLGSTNLRIRYEATLFSRLERVRLISDWQPALDHLRVCTMNRWGELNCGQCEKCVRTMLELLAVGGLEKTGVFGFRDVFPEMLEGIHFTERYQDAWYVELIDPLAQRGRLDLAKAIQKKHLEFQKRLAWEEERDWKGAIKRFDRRMLGSGLYRAYGALRSNHDCAAQVTG